MERAPERNKRTNDPDVILDVLLRDRVLYLVLSNRRDHPVRDVRVTFRRKLTGLGGVVDIAALPLWQKLDFLAPGRVIEVPLDRAEVFFARERSTKLAASVAYTDPDGIRFQAAIVHDLGAYQDFPGIVVRQVISP